MKLLIFSSKNSSRLTYLLEVLFGEILNMPYDFTVDKSVFEKCNGLKIHYGQVLEENCINIYSQGLLFETTVEQKDLNIDKNENYPYLFKCKEDKYSLPFDLFSASFYLISRYEEYIETERDAHNRFKASSSLAYKYKFLQIPIVEVWLDDLLRLFQQQYPNFSKGKKKFEFIATYDIDQFYFLKNKSEVRILKAFLTSVKEKKWKELWLKINILLGKSPDPYDVYEELENFHEKNKIKRIYFFLLSKRFKSGLNGNLNRNNLAKKKQIKILAENTEVGIHPSYYSSKNSKIIEDEKKFLENLIKKNVVKSRQHYLKFNLPETYLYLIENKIEEDYSMGFADNIGYRAGTSKPFYFFDLNANQKTKLRVIPFFAMDVSFHKYLKMDVEESFKILNAHLKLCKEKNYTLITLWHNESISDYGIWKGWKKPYYDFLKNSNA